MTAGPTTQAFNEHSGLVYRNGKKRAVTDSAERGGKKIGMMKKGKEFTAISGVINKDGELRLRCPRGWVTARLADGTKVMELVPTNCIAAAVENIDENATPSKLPARRKRTMTMALGERKAALQNVFVPEGAGTPTKAMVKCAEKGQVVATADQIAALIAKLTEANGKMGAKKIAKQIQIAQPMWSCGCKEVRASLRASVTA